MKMPLFLMIAVFVSPLAQAAFDDGNPLTMWDTSPAHEWSSECYPIGNGRLGAMPFGGTGKEHIQYNEDTLWVGDEKSTGAHQNFGDLYIELGHGKVENYVRKLDLRHGVESIRYTCNGVAYNREYFASMVDNVMVFRFSADKKGAYNAVVSLVDAHKGKVSVENENTIVSVGDLKGGVYQGDKPYDQFLDYESRIMVVNDGGTLSKSGSTLSIKGADGFTIFMVAGTNFKQDQASGWRGEHPHAGLVKILGEVSSKNYSGMVMEHMRAYDKIFNRLSINLGTTDNELLNKTTAERMDAYKSGSKDPDLEEMLFQYARYLMIGSSRIGGLPANLQGLWNNSNNPPWRCDFHSDVNIEMNYWFVDMDNLSECFLPFPAWLKSINSVRVAETHKAFNARGWLTHGENGPFGGSTWLWAKGDSAWMMQNLWDHYQFTLDKEYLENYA
jgi:alpha-L-fucosidase 2